LNGSRPATSGTGNVGTSTVPACSTSIR
jgi:hypothetical protein